MSTASAVFNGIDEEAVEEVKTNPRPATGWGMRGFSAFKEVRAATSDFMKEFKVEDQEILIKFLEPEPHIWFRHWVAGAEKKKSFVCPDQYDIDIAQCPLCKAGSKKEVRGLLNVANLNDMLSPVVQMWECSPDPLEKIAQRAEDSKTSPIDRTDLYFTVSKTKGRNGFFEYKVDPVKSRDLMDDFNATPLSDERLARLKQEAMEPEKYLRVSSHAELAEVARFVK